MITVLEEGSYFGEIALITKLRRTATVKTTDYCTMATMSRDILIQSKE